MNESRNYCSLNTWAQGLISPGRLSLFPHSVCGAPAFAGSGGSSPRAPVLLRVHRGRHFSCCPTALCSCSMEACWGRSTVQPWSIWDTLPQLRCLMAELQALQASQWGGAIQLPPAETQLCFGGFQVGVPGGEMAWSYI